MSLTQAPIRVRQLITQLSFSDLSRTGVVPDLRQLTPETVSKRYPPWIYQLSKSYPQTFADFGLFIENVIYTAINNGKMNYTAIWSNVSDIPVPAQLQQANNFLGGIIGWISPLFRDQSVEHNLELTYKQVQGHPDFFCRSIPGNEKETWIIDVKCTANFKKMSEQTFLQILAYSALARINGHSSNYIGVLLPLQRQIIWYNVSLWDHRMYLNLLLREARWVPKDLEIYNPLSIISETSGQIALAPNVVGLIGRYLDSEILGSHIRKDSVFDSSFRNMRVPAQIFLSNPHAKGFVAMEEIAQIAQNIAPETQLFVHAPYIINLSSQESWPVERLRHELLACQRMGGKGVVVHVGKYKDQDYRLALNQMETSIRTVLDAASEQCPLLLETPAGEGTELCAGLTEFQAFYDRFGGDKRLKICIDTAHIWAAGYDPSYYVRKWLNKDRNSIGLIHFNDSEVPRGSRVDKHYPAGLGYIGYKRLWDVHELCREQNIAMVRE